MIDGLYRMTLDAKRGAFLRLYEDGTAQYGHGQSDDAPGWLNRYNQHAIQGTYVLNGDDITIELQQAPSGRTVSGKGILKEGVLNLVFTWNDLGQKEGGRFAKIKWTAAMARIERTCMQKSESKTPTEREAEAIAQHESQAISRNLVQRQLSIREALALHRTQLAAAFERAKHQKDHYILAAVVEHPSDEGGQQRLFIIHNERCRPYDYGFWSVDQDETGEHRDLDNSLGEAMWLNANGEVLFGDDEPPRTVLLNGLCIRKAQTKSFSIIPALNALD